MITEFNNKSTKNKNIIPSKCPKNEKSFFFLFTLKFGSEFITLRHLKKHVPN
jgi:hypothetical protein